MEPALSCRCPFNRHDERAMPDRRVGNRRRFQGGMILDGTTASSWRICPATNLPAPACPRQAR